MPTRLGRLIYALFFISLPGRLPCLAQNAPAPDTSAPTLKVYSREIVVDTTVTDNKGNPVHGLTRSTVFTSTPPRLSPHRPNFRPTPTPISSPPRPAAQSTSSGSTSQTSPPSSRPTSPTTQV
jgi:hypothetical protein